MNQLQEQVLSQEQMAEMQAEAHRTLIGAFLGLASANTAENYDLDQRTHTINVLRSIATQLEESPESVVGIVLCFAELADVDGAGNKSQVAVTSSLVGSATFMAAANLTLAPVITQAVPQAMAELLAYQEEASGEAANDQPEGVADGQPTTH